MHKEANMQWTGDPQCWTHKPQDYSYSHTCSLIVGDAMIPSRQGVSYFAVFPLFSQAVSVSHHCCWVSELHALSVVASKK
jgi:hypothetical protein